MSARPPLRQFTVKVKSGDLREEVTVLAASTGEALSIAMCLLADEETCSCSIPPAGVGFYARPSQSFKPRAACAA